MCVLDIARINGFIAARLNLYARNATLIHQQSWRGVVCAWRAWRGNFILRRGQSDVFCGLVGPAATGLPNYHAGFSQQKLPGSLLHCGYVPGNLGTFPVGDKIAASSLWRQHFRLGWRGPQVVSSKFWYETRWDTKQPVRPSRPKQQSIHFALDHPLHSNTSPCLPRWL